MLNETFLHTGVIIGPLYTAQIVARGSLSWILRTLGVVGRATDYPTDIVYFSDRRRLGIPSRRQVSFTPPIVRADTRPRGSGVGNYPGVQEPQVPKDGRASTYISIAESLGGISRGHGTSQLSSRVRRQGCGRRRGKECVFAPLFFMLAVLLCKLSMFSESK